MPVPYTLTLFFPSKPDVPEKIFSSEQMIGYGLWLEFEKLSHVTLQYKPPGVMCEISECDFTLIHCCFDGLVFNRLPEIRDKTLHKIMLIMEFDRPNTPLIDHTFSFLTRQNTEQVRLPCQRSFLDTNNSTKISGSILLDHQWSHTKEHEDLCYMLYEWLEPLHKAYNISQLRRPDAEAVEVPKWITGIPTTNYANYLAQTATYETFIMTHRGSYEHSIIDMAARGTRVLVPTKNGRTFCHPSIVEDLNLSTFSCKEELFALLKHLPPQSPTNKFTDMSDVVSRIDAYCQESIKCHST